MKYQYENWNQAMLKDPVKAHKIITGMLPGNLYAFMNTLLDFEYVKEIGMYGPKKERRFGTKRS